MIIKGDPALPFITKTYTAPNQSVNITEEQGHHATSAVFGGIKAADCLAKLHYKTFTKKAVSVSSFVTPERLPPTEVASQFQCRWVYYQIVVWMGPQIRDGISKTISTSQSCLK